jgi:very-short-patch-repair endonuclease
MLGCWYIERITKAMNEKNFWQHVDQLPAAANKPALPHSDKRQDYVGLLRVQLRGVGLPQPRAEYRFHHTRHWRLDFAWPEVKLALEVEGGTYMTTASGHRSISGLARDLAKYNELACAGWLLLRVRPEQLELESGEALRLIERAYEAAHRRQNAE